MAAGNFVPETVKRCHYVRMRLQVDPASDVLVVGDLPDDELLSEVFVVDDKGSVADDVFDL